MPLTSCTSAFTTTYSYLFNSTHHFDSYLQISLDLNNMIPHISSSWDASAVSHRQKFDIFTANVRPWPLITFLLLFLCPPSSPYQRPSLLIQHASMVTFSHECPGNPPHLLFKSMQITTSKSSGASSETELCTCGGGGVHVHSSTFLSSSTMFMSCFKRSHAFF